MNVHNAPKKITSGKKISFYEGSWNGVKAQIKIIEGVGVNYGNQGKGNFVFPQKEGNFFFFSNFFLDGTQTTQKTLFNVSYIFGYTKFISLNLYSCTHGCEPNPKVNIYGLYTYKIGKYRLPQIILLVSP